VQKLPPFARAKEDIALLADYFLEKYLWTREKRRPILSQEDE